MPTCFYCQDAPCYTGLTVLGTTKTFNECFSCRLRHLEEYKQEIELEISTYNPHPGCNTGSLEQLRADLRDVTFVIQCMLDEAGLLMINPRRAIDVLN